MKSNLTKRQEKIIEFLATVENLSIRGLMERLNQTSQDISKVTLNRDLSRLIELNYVLRKGSGRAFFYTLAAEKKLDYPIDLDSYFSKQIDNREAKTSFNFDILSSIQEVFNSDEKDHLKKINQSYRANIKKLPKEILKKEFERLTIDFSWKSSQIEGNTYTLLETEALLAHQQLAKGHPKEEAQMILNHKLALKYIQENQKDFTELSVRKIEMIHSLLVEGLDLKKNLRETMVGITGTNYRPLDNQYQIQDAMEKLCAKVNGELFPHAKAFLLNLFIAYIQPFTDGNKRTSRMLGNAILLSYNLCPLSFRSIDTTEYKKAVLLFYEQNNLSYFKELFLQQAEFAIGEYFRA